MSKKVYISGNTANCFDEFTLCCIKDFENKFLTNNSSLVDDKEYFYADFKSVENIESCYENKIIKLQDEITDLQHLLEVAEKALTKAVNDKCKAENIIAESFVGKGAKIAVPKKEQWYLEQAERELKGDKNE